MIITRFWVDPQAGTAALALSLALSPAAAIAQAEASAVPADAAGETHAAGEIVVTATKRAANAQDVPLAISVLGGEAIATSQIRDGIGLSRQTPNLAAESVMGAAMPRYRLRGIGTNDFAPTATSSVGLYEDEVFLAAGSAQSEPLYDLDRVEVLRGPQGALWGKNTTAGAIHLVTAKPTAQFTGQGRLVFGTDNTAEAEGGLGGRVAEGVNARLAGVYKHRDGQYINDSNGTEAGRYDIWDLRGQVDATLAPGADLQVKVHGGKSVQDQPLGHIGLLASGTDFDGYAQSATPGHLSNNGSGHTEARRFGADARLLVDLGGLSLTEIAAFEHSSSLIYSDDDANPVSNYEERYGGNSDTFTNELRLASRDGGKLGWIAGTYFLHDITRSFGQLANYGPINFGVNGNAYDFRVRTDNLAGFGSVTYALTPQLHLAAGGRYTWERKAVSGRAWEYVTQPGDLFDASRVGLLYVDTAQGRYVDTAGSPIAASPGHRSWRKVTWDVSLDYKLSRDALLFARVAQGFRSGAFNTYVAAPGDLSVYDPETLTSYEGGIKTQWLHRRVTFNLTGFHYDIADMQVTVLQDVGTRTQNAASAKVDGFEVELAAGPFEGLTFNLGYGFQASKYVDFTKASVPFPINRGSPLDLTGQSLERAPRHTLNLAGRYETPLAGGTLIASTDWRYTSRYRFQVWSDAVNISPAPFLDSAAMQALVRDAFSQRALWLGDARLAWRAANGVEVALWVKNLTDRAYRTNTFGMFFNRSVSYYPGERRTAGVALSGRF